MNSAQILEHLMSITGESWILDYMPYLVGIMLFGVFVYKIFLRIKGRKEVYKKFDSKLFWGYLFLALAGGFVWFSIDQLLPTLGTYLALYLWLGFLLGYGVYLVVYCQRNLAKELKIYHEKKRKEKYLK